MAFTIWNPYNPFLHEMVERGGRASFRPLRRIDPLVDMIEAAGLQEQVRPPLEHAPDKPLEQLLADEMAYFEVPIEPEGAL